MDISYFITGAAIALAFGVVGTTDYSDQDFTNAHYCEMVALWHSQSHIPEEKRAGWPPYKGECD